MLIDAKIKTSRDFLRGQGCFQSNKVIHKESRGKTGETTEAKDKNNDFRPGKVETGKTISDRVSIYLNSPPVVEIFPAALTVF